MSLSGPEALEKYRASQQELARTTDLVRLLPRGRKSVLDVGARDGHFTRLLTEHFPEVTALDLTRPSFEIPGVTTVAGDATQLAFPDNAFDCVFCAEVLEHIPALEAACKELLRVARHEVIIGVPYRQDTRVGRTTCPGCGKTNPPWGHVNEFDEAKLRLLFVGAAVREVSLVGENREATTALAAGLMDLGGNPWGSYDQEEPCIYCGSQIMPPEQRSLAQKVLSGVAVRLDSALRPFVRPHGNWIHMVFAKDEVR